MSSADTPPPPPLKQESRLVIIRLAAQSVSEITKIDASNHETSPFTISIECKQVPSTVRAGATALIWLGSDNNKGSATKWKQGFRAIGTITDIKREGKWNDPTTISINIVRVFDASVDKSEIVKLAGASYARLTDFPVIGVNNYASQVAQAVDEESPTQDIRALARTLEKAGTTTILSDFKHLGLELSEPASTVDYSLDSNDSVLSEVRAALQLGFAGVILVGPPGTGKSWYAARIAYALAGDDIDAIAFAQFHPSYQYHDFVEGFVP